MQLFLFQQISSLITIVYIFFLQLSNPPQQRTPISDAMLKHTAADQREEL